MSQKRETLDDMFESIAAEQSKRADELDANPEYQARLAAKRVTQIAREIAQGIRDANGDLIMPDEDEDQEFHDSLFPDYK